MFSVYNNLFLFKKQCYLLYLIFFIFLNKNYWIFFLLNSFFYFFYNIIFNLKSKKNVLKVNILIILNNSINYLNYSKISKLNSFILLFKKYSYKYIYLLLKNIFYSFKIFIFNIYTSFFRNNFDNNFIVSKKKILTSSYSYYNNLNLFINNKMSFYFLYKKSKKIFLSNFSYFDNFLYNIHYYDCTFINKFKSFISSLLQSTNYLYKNNFSYNLNIENTFYINKFYFKNLSNYSIYNIFKRLFFIKNNLLYFIFINPYILDLISKKSYFISNSISISNSMYFNFIIDYNLKDKLNYFFLLNNFYKTYLLLIRSYKKVDKNLNNNVKAPIIKNIFISQKIINFFINKKVYYSLRNKNIFNKVKWYNICNYYYNKIIIFKFILLLLFLSINSNKFYTNYFKYFLLYSELNYSKRIKINSDLQNILAYNKEQDSLLYNKKKDNFIGYKNYFSKSLRKSRPLKRVSHAEYQNVLHRLT